LALFFEQIKQYTSSNEQYSAALIYLSLKKLLDCGSVGASDLLSRHDSSSIAFKKVRDAFEMISLFEDIHNTSYRIKTLGALGQYNAHHITTLSKMFVAKMFEGLNVPSQEILESLTLNLSLASPRPKERAEENDLLERFRLRILNKINETLLACYRQNNNIEEFWEKNDWITQQLPSSMHQTMKTILEVIDQSLKQKAEVIQRIESAVLQSTDDPQNLFIITNTLSPHIENIFISSMNELSSALTAYNSTDATFRQHCRFLTEPQMEQILQTRMHKKKCVENLLVLHESLENLISDQDSHARATINTMLRKIKILYLGFMKMNATKGLPVGQLVPSDYPQGNTSLFFYGLEDIANQFFIKAFEVKILHEQNGYFLQEDLTRTPQFRAFLTMTGDPIFHPLFQEPLDMCLTAEEKNLFIHSSFRRFNSTFFNQVLPEERMQILFSNLTNNGLKILIEATPIEISAETSPWMIASIMATVKLNYLMQALTAQGRPAEAQSLVAIAQKIESLQNSFSMSRVEGFDQALNEINAGLDAIVLRGRPPAPLQADAAVGGEERTANKLFELSYAELGEEG